VKSDGESDGYNQFAFSAGPAIFLSQHTALELLLQYRLPVAMLLEMIA
jgi:hypothetical protein